MKHLRLFVIVAMFGIFSMALNACKDKTGDLIVTVKNELGENMTGKTVYLYGTQSDYDNLLYSETAQTNEYGEASFYELEPGTYYFDADFTFLGFEYNAVGSAQVIAGHETSVTIQP